MFRSPRNQILALAVAAVLAAGSLQAQSKADPINTWQTSNGLGTQYRDMGATIAQIQTIKRIPFFNYDGKQKLDRFSTYGTAVKQGNYRSVATNVTEDFSSGLLKDLGTIFLTDILNRVAKGQDINEAASEAIKGMTTKDFLVGNLLGGTLGAAIGTMVPVPILPGIAGQMMGNLPMMAGAMLGTRVGLNLIHGKTAFDGINALDFVTQAVGSSVGMVLGGMLPVPTLGPIVGGAIGGSIGLKVAAWLRDRAHKVVPVMQSVAGPASGTSSLPLNVASAPQAPSASENLAGLAPSELKSLSDSHYRDYLKAAAKGSPLEAAASLASYKAAQQALTSQR